MERLRYDTSHWSREVDLDKALEQVLQLSESDTNQTELRMISSLIGDISGKRMLDYGGGTGILAIPYARRGNQVDIVDAEENALQTAMHYAKKVGVEDKVRTVHSESVSEDIKKNRYDVIIAKDIIEHIQDDQGFLS